VQNKKKPGVCHGRASHYLMPLDARLKLKSWRSVMNHDCQAYLGYYFSTPGPIYGISYWVGCYQAMRLPPTVTNIYFILRERVIMANVGWLRLWQWLSTGWCIMFTPARDFLLETPWRIIIPLIFRTKKGVNLSSCVVAKPKQLLSMIICLFKR
jgi:hypothetical protein